MAKYKHRRLKTYMKAVTQTQVHAIDPTCNIPMIIEISTDSILEIVLPKKHCSTVI